MRCPIRIERVSPWLGVLDSLFVETEMINNCLQFTGRVIVGWSSFWLILRGVHGDLESYSPGSKMAISSSGL